MNYNKIGQFIAEERKAKKLTQTKLAQMLYISEKTVSKWENGNGIPDTNLLPKLCEIFGISLNELLNGERLTSENYINKAEEKLLELQKEKQSSDKRLLISEIVLASLSLIAFFAILFPCLYAIYKLNIYVLPTIIIFLNFVIFIASMCFCLYIEQKAGYYICKKCGHKYVPTYKQVNLAMHMGRIRYIKCPCCKKYSWQKKVIK